MIDPHRRGKQVILHENMFQASKELDLILIGKTGNGKSATGNVILNKDKNTFAVSYDSTSKTENADYGVCEYMGYKLQVVDCPGVFDTRMDRVRGIEQVKEALESAIMAEPKGYHAFVVVVKFASRMTKEEIETIEILKNILGTSFLRNHGVIVMTNGDTFSRFVKDEGLTIETFCEKQDCCFKQLLKECNNRIVVFDNQTYDDTIKNMQREQLIKMVEMLNNDGKRYTNEHFQNAQILYQKMLEKEKEIFDKNLMLAQRCLLERLRDHCSTSSQTIDGLKQLLVKLTEIQLRVENIDDEKTFKKDLEKNIRDTIMFVCARISQIELGVEQTTSRVLDTIIKDYETLEKKMKSTFFSYCKDKFTHFGKFIFETAQSFRTIMQSIFR